MIPRSVTSRLIFLYCIILLLLGGAFLAFAVFSFRHYAQETITKSLAIRAGEIWNISADLLDHPEELKSQLTRRFSPETQDRFIRIRRNDELLYLSGKPANVQFSPLEVPDFPPNKLEGALYGDLLFYSRDFVDAKGNVVVVDTGQNYAVVRTVQARLARSLLIGLPFLLLLAALAGYFVMRRALKPIETMINAAESYTFNKPHARLPTTGTEPRIEALGLALNRLLDRLDSAYSHVSRFTADAAHELRTPLTIIRGELELVARKDDLSREIDQPIRTVLEEMTRLSSLVDTLISLARMDSFWGKTSHTVLDFRALSRETVEQMQLLLEEKNIAVTCVPGPAVNVVGDHGRLKQVLVNLLDNAVKYTKEGGSVSVDVYSTGMMGVLAVEDTGIGIDVKHHEKVFDRFYRVSPERGTQGAGLGLAIVKSICLAHGGAVSVRSVPGMGSCFVVEIPLARSDISVTSEKENVTHSDQLAETH